MVLNFWRAEYICSQKNLRSYYSPYYIAGSVSPSFKLQTLHRYELCISIQSCRDPLPLGWCHLLASRSVHRSVLALDGSRVDSTTLWQWCLLLYKYIRQLEVQGSRLEEKINSCNRSHFVIFLSIKLMIILANVWLNLSLMPFHDGCPEVVRDLGMNLVAWQVS